MVLKILDSDLGHISEVPSKLEDFLRQYIKPKYGQDFLRNETMYLSCKNGLVYVGQSEVGIIDPKNIPNHGLTVLGSEDATTCHIVIFRHCSTGKTALAHLDSISKKGLHHIVNQLCLENDESGNQVEVHIFGGYEDERDISEELSLDLLKFLIRNQRFVFKLGFCVIGSINTWFGEENSSKRFPRPRLYGVGINVETGQIVPADFISKTPDEHLRHVRLSYRQFRSHEEFDQARDFLYQDFNDDTGEFTIEPFEFVQRPDLVFIANAPDRFILENMSTSPKVEPEHFCSNIKSAVKLVLEHPEPLKTLFPHNKARKYKFSVNEQKWIRINTVP